MKIMRLAPLENARRPRSRPGPVRRYQVGASLPGPPQLLGEGGRLARPALAALFWIGLLAATPATTNYVAQDGQTPAPPYTSWATAASNIQDAINQAIAGDTVLVSNGVYEVGGVTNFPTGTLLTNRVAIWKAITVRSKDNDPTNTIIKGAWDPTSTNGPAAVRCVYMVNGSSLIGFTLTNGATLVSWVAGAERGGGVSCQSTNTTISNCVLTGNSAYVYGGGVSYGTLFNCTLTRNSAIYGLGGGMAYATLYDCTIVSNTSTGDGGGAYYGTLTNCTLIGNVAAWGGGAAGSTQYNCTLSGNQASQAGGGVRGGTLYNCTLTNNSSSSGNGGGGAYGSIFYNCTLVGNSNPSKGGGAIYGALYNCLLSGNSAANGGGAQNSALYNCTVSGNSASSSGGGVNASTLINSIVYFNSATSGSNWYAVVTFTNTCTVPAATNGVGNITDNPLFVNTNAANYRLSVYSPPLNAGTNFSWMTDPAVVHSKDLDGSRRIDRFSGQVDMGCYELLPAGTMFIMK